MPTYKKINLVNAKFDGLAHTGTLQIEVIDRKITYVIEVFITCEFKPDCYWVPEVNEETPGYRALADLIPDSDEIKFIQESIRKRAGKWVFKKGKAEFYNFLALEALPKPDSNAPRRKPTL